MSTRLEQPTGWTSAIIHAFLHSNLSLIMMLLAAALGIVALLITPREEDPQIVVPLADVYVQFPGHSAREVEQLVTTPLEKLLYQIDGVEYVYSMSHDHQAVITVRFRVGEDRERSLVKIYKRIDEHIDQVPDGVTGWVVKPVEIDDVPIVMLTLTSASSDEFALRRVAEELSARLADIENLSRTQIVGGQPRVIHIELDPLRLAGYQATPLEVARAIQGANYTLPAGEISREDRRINIEAGKSLVEVVQLRELVIGIRDDRPVLLKDVAEVVDGPAEAAYYVRHRWGPSQGFEAETHFPGQVIGSTLPTADPSISLPAVTIALAKKKGTNAVWVAEEILNRVEQLRTEIVPSDIDLVITRNYGLTANEKVNELVEALAVAIFIVIALLTLGLGWREALIVAVAVPVVFGMTLLINLLFGYTINRVTLFALILSLGLLVDDPIVDVENITRHFSLHRRATREIVMEAVAEIRPPLITATLAVIVSFLPMFFITGMMGPYMRPMALNVPVAMLMSMVVAFMITPWLSYHLLRKRYDSPAQADPVTDPHDTTAIRQSRLYRFFYPMMAAILKTRRRSLLFLVVIALMTMAAGGLAATRHVPLKMLPFDNKNELLLVLDFDEGTTLERNDAAIRDLEEYLSQRAEVVDLISYVGIASPMDFNGLVRHYYLRQGANVAEIRVNLVGKKSRTSQSHALGLAWRDELTAIATRHGAVLRIVETPPGPPVIATLVAEIYGRPDHSYAQLLAAAEIVRQRVAAEPRTAEVDDIREAGQTRWRFVTDLEKAALHGLTSSEIAQTLQLAVGGYIAGQLHESAERQPLNILLRLPQALRSSRQDLLQLFFKGSEQQLIPLAELGQWREEQINQTIYHKNLQRVVYVFAETVGRAPAEAVVDILADQVPVDHHISQASDNDPRFVNSAGWTMTTDSRPLAGRTFLKNGSHLPWQLNDGFRVDFAGEGEWKITLDVFRDLGLAFAAALLAIYILLVAQTGSFLLPMVVMLAIPLSVLGIMPGFWMLNLIAGGMAGGYANPIFFTATGMIGMIALAGIVIRDAIILVDFIHLAQSRGRTLFEAIMESRVVRLRPILLTAGTALLSAAPIAIDPIFSGLAWALIFGLIASTFFTLLVIPVAYWLIYSKPDNKSTNKI
ncbi:MAG: Efflux pump membrane transporter BepE [Phycisphaerae bacterium]|nr:Efflux pump membrane transporter BepE [Phycisphaerae bacterium]